LPKIKQLLGDSGGVAVIQSHHRLVRELLKKFKEAKEISTGGDSFFIVFDKPSEAVLFALLLQARLRALPPVADYNVRDRIGIHLGEVVIETRKGMPHPKDLYGLQVDTCARVMSLAGANQILLTRSVFDNARQVLTGKKMPGLGKLDWRNYGSYFLEGLETTQELCEVGEVDFARLQPPIDGAIGKRQDLPASKATIGWLCMIGQPTDRASASSTIVVSPQRVPPKADFNGDGWLDFYVANDGTANQLWRNRGDGTFADEGLASGTAYSADGLPQGSMGLAVGDFDGDADEDILVTNLPREGSALYVNDGAGRFQDLTEVWGLRTPSLRSTGFGADWFDYDNDGRLDLFVANGAVNLIQALRGSPYPFQEKSLLFHNPGRAPFLAVSAGPAIEHAEVSRGAAFGDVNEDGGVDVLVTNNNGPARLLLNEVGSRGHWLKVRLSGTQDNAEGQGARVAVLRRGVPALWRRAHTDGSYLSASDVRVHFGLGTSPEFERVLASWPSGRTESWSGLAADRTVELKQGTGKPWTGPLP
jgi:class 3 adenylate cyclase